METAGDGFLGHAEVSEGVGAARIHILQSLLREVECGRCRVGLEVGARPISLQRIGPLWDSPFELRFGKVGRSGKPDGKFAATGRDRAESSGAGERSRPEACERSTAGVQGKQ